MPIFIVFVYKNWKRAVPKKKLATLQVDRFRLRREKTARLYAKTRTFERSYSLVARVLRRPRFFWCLS